MVREMEKFIEMLDVTGIIYDYSQYEYSGIHYDQVDFMHGNKPIRVRSSYMLTDNFPCSMLNLYRAGLYRGRLNHRAVWYDIFGWWFDNREDWW